MVMAVKFWGPKLCRRPVSTGSDVAPPSAKSPSHVPDVPALRWPEFPADEKYSAPSAVTSLTAWITTPPLVFETTLAAWPSWNGVSTKYATSSTMMSQPAARSARMLLAKLVMLVKAVAKYNCAPGARS